MPARLHFATAILASGALLMASSATRAQVDRSAVTGTVSDDAGKLMRDTRVTATEIATGLRRECVTSQSGDYVLPELPVGTYTLTFQHAGFAQLTYTRVLETVGRTRTLNAVLHVAAGTEQVQVSDVASEINQNSDALGARIEPKQVQQLPLNGRDWSTLTALVPGAVDTGGSNQRTIRFAGRGLDDNNFTYDGVDATNIVNQAQQPFVRLAIPTESIQEFRIDTMLFTAESGSTPGGQVAVVSRTGSNVFHGNVFEFLRNDIFDAREPIDPVKHPFRLNQFGGSIGGPLTRDKTFFFVTYEGLRQTLGQTLPGLVPSAALRAQLLAQSPALAPIVAAFPVGGSLVANQDGLVANFTGTGRQLDQENSGMIRLDHRFSSRDTADLRFNFDAARSSAPLAGNNGTYTNDTQEITSRPVNGVIEYLHLFSPAWVNETKFGFNRGNVYTTNIASVGLPYAIAVSGLTTLNNNEYKLGVGNSYSYIDDLTWVHGRHTVKLGVEARRIQLNQGNTAYGTVTYASLQAFEANRVSSASFAAALPVNGLRKTYALSFLQDEWKLRSTVTINAGVRYSFFDVFHEVLGRAVPFDFASCGSGGFCGVGASFGNPRRLDFDPRLSVSWAPQRLGGNTVFRSGFGTYHGDGQLDDQNLPISNEVGRFSLNGKTNVSYPVAPYLVGLGVTSPRDMDRDRHDAYVTEYGLSVQQSFDKGWVGTFSYDGSKGTNLLRTSYTNLIDPATGLRPIADPVFGQVETRGNRNSSSFNAFVAQIRRAFANGFLFQANYEFAHEIDRDAAGGGDSDFPENPACLSCERASGDFDVRSVFSGNTVYELPFGRGKQYLRQPGIASAVLGNWQVSSIVSARTGLPVNVTIDRSSTFNPADPGSTGVATGYTISQRPNRVPGVPLRPAGGSAIHDWINPAAFATVTGGGYGDAGRNLVRAPGLWQADMGLAKSVHLTETAQLQLRGEFFNLFNRAQYGSPLADVTGSAFGVITNTVNTGPVGTGTPRQVQFMLRLGF